LVIGEDRKIQPNEKTVVVNWKEESCMREEYSKDVDAVTAHFIVDELLSEIAILRFTIRSRPATKGLQSM